MPITWKRNGERRIHVFMSRPGYTRLLYMFEAPPFTSDARIAEEIAVRDPVTGVRFVRR